MADERAAISAEEADQPMCGRDISTHGVRASSAIMLKMDVPLRGKRLSGMNQVYR